MSSFYFRNRVLLDGLHILLLDLLELEHASRGEPMHYAYEHACLTTRDMMQALRDELRQAELRQARNNPYYRPVMEKSNDT